MLIKSISCPGGSASQTGSAVKERYPDAKISNCGLITDVKEKLLDGETDSYVIPIWNSHEGEVEKAIFFWDLIEQEKIKVTDLWVKQIEFWFVTREPQQYPLCGKIGSVFVAKTQCSGFFESKNAELVKRDLTTVAFDEYRKGAEWDGVLVAPGQGADEYGYIVSDKQTANPNNFTTFVKIVRSDGVQLETTNNTNTRITGVTMRPFETSLGETERSFFDEMFNFITDLNQMPRLIFAFKRTSKVGLLFEGASLCITDLLNEEEIESGNISMYEKAGSVFNLYTEELSDLFNKKFPALGNDDFIIHQGINTCLFACPPLGLYTHGYEVETVEPVVRFYINKIFELIDNGVKCTQDQTQFFKRHKDDWQEKQSQFIKFKKVDPT